ncbi:hypothetical protein NDU88_006268 [Pleurodeles waltl]|uniref:Uncharacterized protein n=1 Tax=Pleurodeles waltl TaxID=8319 RepID=A0AAV7TEC0_PLEWA|nr:hypothetical protein NDU88_006268 [Pleurodeles waltl]
MNRGCTPPTSEDHPLASPPQTVKRQKRTCSGAGTRAEERLEAGALTQVDPHTDVTKPAPGGKSAHRRVIPNWHNNNFVGNTLGPVAPPRLGSAESRSPEEVGLGVALDRRCPAPIGAPNTMGMP